MNQYLIIALTILFLLLVLPGENAYGQKIKYDLVSAKNYISESNEIYFLAFTTGDSTLFIERYAKDCCIMPPNNPSMCGQNAAADFFKTAYHQMGIRNGRFITKEVYGDGSNYLTEEGLFELFDANDVLVENGKYLVLWKYTDAGWKMYRDSFNTNRSK